MKYTFNNEDGTEEVVDLPTNMEVCTRCGGHGTHDCWEGGMTGQEMDEQGPEFFDDYMAGVYSKTCTVCHGRNVVEVVDRERLTPELRVRYDAAEQERAEYEAERQMEIRMGC